MIKVEKQKMINQLYLDIIELVKEAKPNSPEWSLSWRILENIKVYFEDMEVKERNGRQ